MNKKAKLLLVLLSAATVTAAGAFGLAGCKNEENADPTSATSLYNTYKQYTESNGQTALSYEQWLLTIQSNLKGDKGDPGKNGNNGEDGESGESGVGVDRIVWGEQDGVKGLVIIYTDTTQSFVPLPEQVTHEHTYNYENVTVVIPKSDTAAGLGYVECTDKGCSHKELVAISESRRVYVSDADNNPVADATVKINGVSATTNASGVANILNFGVSNEYVVTVEKEGYMASELVRVTDDSDLDITIVKVAGQETRPNDSLAHSVVSAAGTYGVSVPTNEDDVETVEFAFLGGEEGKFYRVTPLVSVADIKNASYNGVSLLENGKCEIFVKAGQESVVYFTADFTTLSSGGFDLGAAVVYSFKVEELPFPEAGTKINPIDLEANGTVTIPATADEDGYVYYNWTNIVSDISEADFETENAIVEIYCKAYNNDTWKYDDEETPTVFAGSPITLATGGWGTPNSTGTYKVRVKPAAAGAASFKLKADAPAGSVVKPYDVEFGTTISAGADEVEAYKTVWYKYTPTEKKICIFDEIDAGSIRVYEGQPEGDNTPYIIEISDGKTSGAVDFKADTDYYFSVQAGDEGGFSFKLRAATDADKGVSAALPKDLAADIWNAGKFTAEVPDWDQTYVYYSYTAPADGTLAVSVPPSSSPWFEDYMLELYSADGELLEGNSSKYKQGDTIVFGVCSNYSETTFEVTLVWKAAETPVNPGPGPDEPGPGPDEPGPEKQKVAHTINVKDSDGNPVNGVTVTVNGETATTENGTVTLNFVPGSYSINVSGFDKNDYFYETAAARVPKTNEAATSYDVVLTSSKKDVSFVVAEYDDEGTALSKKFAGATVTVYRNEGSNEPVKVGDYTTDSNGTVNLQLVNGYTYKFELELSAADQEDYGMSVTGQSTSVSDGENVIMVVAKTVYNLKVADDSGKGVRNIDLTVKQGNNVVATIRTAADGTASFKAMKGLTYKVTGNVDGYSLSECTIHSGTDEANTITITMAKGDKVCVGADSGNIPKMQLDADDPYTMVIGVNAVNNQDAAEMFYGISASGKPGTYTVTIDDAANEGYFTLISVGTGTYALGYPNLVVNGKQYSADNNLVLGAVRGTNKVYSFSVTIGSGEKLVVGYNTGTGSAGSAYIEISYEGEAETPAQPAQTLTEGLNTVSVSSGTTSCMYTVSDPDTTEIVLTWTTPGVTVTVDGYDVESGDRFPLMGSTSVQVVITSTTETSVEITVTEESAGAL